MFKVSINYIICFKNHHVCVKMVYHIDIGVCGTKDFITWERDLHTLI